MYINIYIFIFMCIYVNSFMEVMENTENQAVTKRSCESQFCQDPARGKQVEDADG